MDDWDVFFDPDDFGDTAFWETQEVESASIDGIFQATAEVVLDGVSAVLPTFTTSEDLIPSTVAQGDDVEVRDTNYRVSDIQLDGSGLARVILERA
jgi:hypothetical protein